MPNNIPDISSGTPSRLKSSRQASKLDDLNGGILKINPLIDWSERQVMEGRWWWENPENKECGLHRR